MTPRYDPAQVRRWQEEVARDPGAPGFVFLAEAYRREGRVPVARRLCLRGLERDPENVQGHYVLGRVHRDAGEQERALDAWELVLRLDPGHHGARRSLGYLCLERREWRAAIRHLERVEAAGGGDDRLAGALDLARRRLAAEAGAERGIDRVAAVVARPLDRFVRDAAMRFVLLVDRSGRILTQRGFPREMDAAAFASLGAGIHAASTALAGMLGQAAFEQLCQGEGERQAFLGRIPAPFGPLLLLGALGTDSNVGLARLAFQRLLSDLGPDTDWPESLEPVDPRALEAELAAGVRRALPGA